MPRREPDRDLTAEPTSVDDDLGDSVSDGATWGAWGASQGNSSVGESTIDSSGATSSEPSGDAATTGQGTSEGSSGTSDGNEGETGSSSGNGESTADSSTTPDHLDYVFDEPETTVVYEDRDGSVTYDPATGRFQIRDPDTMVVYETRTPAGSPPAEAEAIGVVDRWSWEFHQTLDNEQRTNCVTTRFKHAIGGKMIDVSVFVTAPIKLRDGYVISPEEARDDAFSAASYAAQDVASELQWGLSGAGAQKLFKAAMIWYLKNKTLTRWGLEKGYKVQWCTP